MAHVPLMVAAAQSSQRSQELAQQLTGVILAYRSSHPGVTDHEVAQALALAHPRAAGDGSSSPAAPLMLALAIGLVLAVGLTALLAIRPGEGAAAGDGTPWIAVAVGVVAAALGAVVLIIRLRRG
jgi:hypothetical protein